MFKSDDCNKCRRFLTQNDLLFNGTYYIFAHVIHVKD